jgi:hypothetical protein
VGVGGSGVEGFGGEWEKSGLGMWRSLTVPEASESRWVRDVIRLFLYWF